MTKLCAFCFTFEGKYLPGHVIVVSTAEADAWNIAREKVSGMDLDPKSLDLNDTIKLESSAIIYEDNGDY